MRGFRHEFLVSRDDCGIIRMSDGSYRRMISWTYSEANLLKVSLTGSHSISPCSISCKAASLSDGTSYCTATVSWGLCFEVQEGIPYLQGGR